MYIPPQPIHPMEPSIPWPTQRPQQPGEREPLPPAPRYYPPPNELIKPGFHDQEGSLPLDPLMFDFNFPMLALLLDNMRGHEEEG